MELSEESFEDSPNETESSSFSKSLRIYKDTVDRIKLEHGLLHSIERQHLEKRSKSFELLRLLEECTRFHNIECQNELKQGDLLRQEIFSEFYNRRDSATGDDTIYSYAIRRYFEKYLGELNQRKSSDGTLFPWSTYDENMQLNCLTMLKANRIEECRSYLIGYFEVVCRVPDDLLSNQGKLTNDSAGWAIHRHLFGSSIAIFRIALAGLSKDVYMETITPKTLKGIVDSFVLISQQIWTICWEKCSTSCYQLTEILVEAIQHVLFLHCQYLPHLLFGFDSRILTTVTESSLDINPFELVELRQLVKLDDLYRLCGVPAKYHIFPAFSESVSSHQHGHQGIVSAEESCWTTLSQNPFLAVSKDIAVLKSAKTPVEVADVAVSILKAITTVSAHVARPSSGVAANTSSDTNISADEMIPLLTFSFALYFRTPVRFKNSHILRYQNPSNFLSLLKFSEVYLPSHLTMREEGYAVTICLSAMQTLPV